MSPQPSRLSSWFAGRGGTILVLSTGPASAAVAGVVGRIVG